MLYGKSTFALLSTLMVWIHKGEREGEFEAGENRMALPNRIRKMCSLGSNPGQKVKGARREGGLKLGRNTQCKVPGPGGAVSGNRDT